MEIDIKFSVVIPLYNKEKYILRAVNSVLSQSYRNFELVVVDDGSTDGSIAALGEIRNSLTLVKQENAGESTARNAGIRRASNPYIAFLDADDEWHTNFLENIAHMIRSYPECGVFSTNYLKRLDGIGRVAIATKSTEPQKIDYFELARLGNNPASSSSSCVKASVFSEVGHFPVGVRLYPDLYFWTKAALKFEFAFNPIPSATYHREAENRVCNQVIPALGDVAFGELIQIAAHDNTLGGERLKFARQFVTHYQLLNAFKALTQFGSREVRPILENCTPVTFSQWQKKYLIVAASYLPLAFTQAAWRFAKRVSSP